MRLPYDIVDVFTDRPFAGNQLAVVHGAGDLSTEQCQAIAQEFNYSETTFPVRRPGSTSTACGSSRRGRRFRSRAIRRWAPPGCFGPRRARPRATPPGTVAPVPSACASPVSAGSSWLRRRATSAGRGGRFVERLLADLGLSLSDLHGAGLGGRLRADLRARPGDVGGARRRVHVPAARTCAEYAARPVVADPLEGVNVYAVSGERPRPAGAFPGVRARAVGVPEDPATGSAAVGLGIALVATGRLPAGGRYTIVQGVEMGRPSTLYGRVEVDGAGRRPCATSRVRYSAWPAGRSPSRGHRRADVEVDGAVRRSRCSRTRVRLATGTSLDAARRRSWGSTCIRRVWRASAPCGVRAAAGHRASARVRPAGAADRLTPRCGWSSGRSARHRARRAAGGATGRVAAPADGRDGATRRRCKHRVRSCRDTGATARPAGYDATARRPRRARARDDHLEHRLRGPRHRRVSRGAAAPGHLDAAVDAACARRRCPCCESAGARAGAGGPRGRLPRQLLRGRAGPGDRRPGVAGVHPLVDRVIAAYRDIPRDQI